MKKLLFLFALLFSLNSFSQASDLPKNPKPGECYLRCKKADGQLTKWKAINCKLAKDFKNKDEIIKIQLNLISLGYKLEATGFLNEETIDSYIHYKKDEKKILRKMKRKERQKKN